MIKFFLAFIKHHNTHDIQFITSKFFCATMLACCEMLALNQEVIIFTIMSLANAKLDSRKMYNKKCHGSHHFDTLH